MSNTVNTITEVYKREMKTVFEVYEIFKNYYGEEFVDLQKASLTDFKANMTSVTDSRTDIVNTSSSEYVNCLNSICPEILVYWPEVTVTNEYNKSIKIQDLYAKIKIDIRGMIPYEYNGFRLNRATYPRIQYDCNYMHSHVCSIPKGYFEEFQSPCLGRGPIIGTILSLKNSFDETTWMLFCHELAEYVKVESIRGVPYHRLESISNKSELSLIPNGNYLSTNPLLQFLGKEEYSKFIKYYLRNGNLKFGYSGESYVLGNTELEYLIDISNSFISYFNDVLHKEYSSEEFVGEFLKRCIIDKGKIYSKDGLSSRTIHENGAYICEFHGQPVHLRITNTVEEGNYTLLMLPQVAFNILEEILEVVNYCYGNCTNEGASSSNKKVIYL